MSTSESAGAPCRLELRHRSWTNSGEAYDLAQSTEAWCATCGEKLLTVRYANVLFTARDGETRGRIYAAWDAHVLGKQPVDYQI